MFCSSGGVRALLALWCNGEFDGLTPLLDQVWNGSQCCMAHSGALLLHAQCNGSYIGQVPVVFQNTIRGEGADRLLLDCRVVQRRLEVFLDLFKLVCVLIYTYHGIF